MNWLNPFSITLVLSGAVFVIASEIVARHPPKRINSLYGYRTRASMASQERWDFAQKASAVRSRFWGWVMLGLGLLGYAFSGLPMWAGVLLSLAVLLAACIMLLRGTEQDLRRHFGPVA